MPKFRTVLVALIIVSLIGAFLIYYTMCHMLGAMTLEFMSGYAESAKSFEMYPIEAESQEEIDLIKYLCNDTVENISHEEKERYKLIASSCDWEKAKGFANSNDYIELKAYLSLSTQNSMYEIVKSYEEVMQENYPKESLLLMEKIYDMGGMVFLISSAGSTSIKSIGISYVCDEYANRSVGCMHALFEAEGRVADKLESDMVFGKEFIDVCAEYSAWNITNPIPGYQSLDRYALCSRIEFIMRSVFEKVKNKDLGKTGRFFTMITLSGKSFVDYDYIPNMIIEEIDPQYRPYFEAWLNEKQ